jgi:hypothetical protein
MTESDRHLDELLLQYRAACPDVDASAEFMPRLWARIDSRRSFPLVFQRLARVLVTASAAACLVLAALNLAPHSAERLHTKYATYADALSAESALERTYFADSNQKPQPAPVNYRH